MHNCTTAWGFVRSCSQNANYASLGADNAKRNRGFFGIFPLVSASPLDVEATVSSGRGLFMLILPAVRLYQAMLESVVEKRKNDKIIHPLCDRVDAPWLTALELDIRNIFPAAFSDAGRDPGGTSTARSASETFAWVGLEQEMNGIRHTCPNNNM